MISANDCIQALLEDLECARRMIRRQVALMEVTLPLTKDESTIESLVATALDAASSTGQWLTDVIDRAGGELEELSLAPQNEPVPFRGAPQEVGHDS